VQAGRQIDPGGDDGRLDVARGAVDIAVETELQGDAGRSERALRRSSGAATEVAMVSGLAPGMFAVTRITGKSTCGNGATGNCE